MADRLDVVIFGATGFTGKHVILEAIKLLAGQTWGIAGRSQQKLDEVLKEIGTKAGKDLSGVPTILAEVSDAESLRKMAERAKVVVNCCGPYRFYGEPVVKACINAGTHHVDVSGEPQYMERMQLEYNDLAREKGVYVISACGFDSIPADMGTVYFEKQFEGEVNSIESYLQTWVKGGRKSGASLNYGTWESAIYGLAYASELRELRTNLYKERLPAFQPRLKKRSTVHKSNLIDKWCVPFPGSDRSVVLRSQRYMYDNDKKRPIQMNTYIGFRNIFEIIVLAIFGIVFGTMARFQFTRSLLLKHPKLFSGGLFSREGPTDETMRNTKFSITFLGKGWPKSDRLSEPSDQHTEPPTKSLVTRVSATNPGYGATCVAILVSAKTILKEHANMPGAGGVLPPGAAFANTTMIEQLSANGFTFEVLPKADE